MNRPSELIDAYFERELSPDEQAVLCDWLSANPDNMRAFAQEAHLHHCLRREAVGRKVQRELTAIDQPTPASVLSSAGKKVLPFPQLLSLAASVALLLSLAYWLFPRNSTRATLALPANATVEVARLGQILPIHDKMQLLPGDLVRVSGSNAVTILYTPEPTALQLHPGAELRLDTGATAKRFDLHSGKLEATVARQRPFNPMIIATPDAEARVLGTEFTLTAATNRTRLDVAKGEVRLTRTVDDAHVDVPGGYYAIASQDTELAALPMTGAISLEWWIGVSGKSLNDLSDDPRFPNRPDGRGASRAFELKPVATNQFAVRFRGYVHPPITGDYEFWLAAGHDGTLLLTDGERAEDKGQIAIALGPGKPRFWDGPRFNGASQWSPPVPLIAGKRYYIEAIAFIEKGDAHLSVAWKRPNAPRELLMGDFLSPVEPSK